MHNNMADEKVAGEEAPVKLKIKLPTPPTLVHGQTSRNAELGLSSGDEDEHTQDLSPDDARTAIGVSISRQQTRLTSPTTPAIEKTAAIEEAGGFFNVQGDGSAEESSDSELQELDTANISCERVGDGEPGVKQRPEGPGISRVQTEASPPRLPSPWKAESPWQRPPRRKSGLLDGLFGRQRATSSPDTTLQTWQKSLFASLPSVPKMFSGVSAGSEPQQPRIREESSISRDEPMQKASSLARGSPKHEISTRSVHDASQNQAGQSHHQPGMLKRAASDTSLQTQRTLSTVASFGDDSRFEHVQDQVNSRLKAIRDTWQDSSIKLPSMPSVPSFSFTPDFLKEKSGSSKRKLGNTWPSIREPPNQASKPEKPVDPITMQPYTSGKAALRDVSADKSSTHPHFHHALDQLEGDVVILGGYRGSILRSAKPPHRQLWVPMKVGLNLRKVDLEVGLREGDDERASETVVAGGMLTHIGPIDIAKRLFKRLRTSENARLGKLRVHDYGYDWRLDPTYLSSQLVQFLERLPSNQPNVDVKKRGATVIAHSLGGLITRHAVNRRPELFNGVVYAGVPTTCVNILGPMRNGDEVLLSSRVLTAQVNFTIRTSYALLPLDGRCFFNKDTKEEYRVSAF
jgi:hypothetical protein